MNNQEILKQLHTLSETDYQKFHSKITPSNNQILGVRLPTLRKIAQKIAHSSELTSFIHSDKHNIYELIMLEGLSIAYAHPEFHHCSELLNSFLDKVDNWAIIDAVFSTFKKIDKKQSTNTINHWLKSTQEFKQRAALVLLLNHYVEQEQLGTLFRIAQEINDQAYYVHMANAWLISVCMAKYPKETTDFLRNNTLSPATHNKAIQKSQESLSVSQRDKLIIKKLKKNITKAS